MLLLWVDRSLKKGKIQHNGLTYFGKQYNNTEININFDKYKDKIEVIRTNQFVKKAAKLLAEGKVLVGCKGGLNLVQELSDIEVY